MSNNTQQINNTDLQQSEADANIMRVIQNQRLQALVNDSLKVCEGLAAFDTAYAITVLQMTVAGFLIEYAGKFDQDEVFQWNMTDATKNIDEFAKGVEQWVKIRAEAEGKMISLDTDIKSALDTKSKIVV